MLQQKRRGHMYVRSTAGKGLRREVGCRGQVVQCKRQGGGEERGGRGGTEVWRAVVCWREVGEVRFVGGRVVVCVAPVGVRGPLALPLAGDVFAPGGTPCASTWSEVGGARRTAGGGAWATRSPACPVRGTLLTLARQLLVQSLTGCRVREWAFRRHGCVHPKAAKFDGTRQCQPPRSCGVGLHPCLPRPPMQWCAA